MRAAAWRGKGGRLGNLVLRALRRLRRIHKPAVGSIDFGDFAGRAPVSRSFGYDRGTPVDRHYIEGFLARRSGDITGQVLEVGEATYSARFGSGVTRQDVLHVNPIAGATIVGDLAASGTLAEQSFDCIIVTQTLQLIYDLRSAIRNLCRALRPGGVVLATVPGISSRQGGEWAESWCWSLTELSARRLFEEAFEPSEVEISVHGNVYAATCFLQGLALEEVDRVRLDHVDDTYPVIISIRARRSQPNEKGGRSGPPFVNSLSRD